MAITIQELIASDTISQAVDKINFNFDQLLLNGGGPVGPQGIPGPVGPVGGRGLRGATWYDDPAVSPGTDPNTLIIPTVEEDDYYLQSNGDVWQYNGTVWVLTNTNLTGPTGPSGSSFGFNYAGGYPGAASINNQNVAYIVPMPGGIASGANQGTNEAISVAILGGVATTAIPPAGISFTSAFLIPDLMTKSLDSSLLSVLVHQKDSSAAAIKFMGGGAITGDKFEQSVFANLSDISLGVDDSLNINIPKAATSPLSISDLIGFNLNTLKRGQQFYAGKHINFLSGVDTSPSGLGSELSDITFIVGTSNPSVPAKFGVSTTYASASALFEVGGNITVPTTPTTKTGKILGEADNISLWGNTVYLASNVQNRLRIDSSGIALSSAIGPISLTTASQNIEINAGLTLTLQGGTITQTTAGGDININTGGIGNIYLEPSTATHSVRIDNVVAINGGVKFKGNITWGAISYQAPSTTSYRHITINRDDIANNKPPIVVQRNDPGGFTTVQMAKFAKNNAGSAIEEVGITTSAIEINNYSGNNGFVGFRVQNGHTTAIGVNFGVQVVGRDSVTGNTGTKFHAREDMTEVSNRFRYTRKQVKINPLTANIASAAGGIYTIPASFMDTSFLDVYIGYEGGPYAAISTSYNDFDIYIPNGVYNGQRLALHVLACPTRIYDGGTQYNWPSTGNTANIGIWLTKFAEGTSAQIGTISTSAWNAGTPLAGEFFVELMWLGTNYTTVYNTSSSSTTYNTERGWVITNVLSPTIGAAAATNTDAQMKAQVDLTP